MNKILHRSLFFKKCRAGRESLNFSGGRPVGVQAFSINPLLPNPNTQQCLSWGINKIEAPLVLEGLVNSKLQSGVNSSAGGGLMNL